MLPVDMKAWPDDGDLLPLRGVKSIAVIGGNADRGVLAGGGSSDVTPVGGAVMIDNHTFMPSPPLAELKRELPRARIAFDAGTDPAAAAALAAQSDVAVVFVTQHDSEGYDGSLELAGNQDALVGAVAKANRRTSWSKAAAPCSCPGPRKSPRSSRPSIPAFAAARRSRGS
jgi:beta-glucosidase